MKEAVIQDFFAGRASAQELALESAGAFERHTDGAGTQYAHMSAVAAPGVFEVRAQHMQQLLDALEAGELDLGALEAVCFCVEASDGFTWDADETEDGRRVAEALFLLGSPEVNYPLTPAVLQKVRHLLLTGEDTFTAEDAGPKVARPHLISQRSWERAQDV